MKAIFLNGPKGCGKDSIGTEICERHINYRTMKFAEPLYEAIRAVFSLTPDEWSHMYENHKEEPSDALMGMSPRQAMIWLSEDVMKPKFGQTFFGDSVAHKLHMIKDSHPNDVIIFTDSGFPLESHPVVNELGAENCMLVRLSREGSSFVGDSRSYWNPSDGGLSDSNMIEIINDGTIGGACKVILSYFERIVLNKGKNVA